ncbi:MAG: FecR domain-containing protein, partial [Niabella sp.]
MSRCIFKEANEAEVNHLHELLRDNFELQQQYELLSRVLKPEIPDTINEPDYTLKALELLKKADLLQPPLQERPLTRQLRHRMFYWVAAASVILAGGIVFFKYTGLQKDRLKPVLITGEGVRKNVILPDGTRVWLNAGSGLYYLNDFNGATREVKLNGE